MEIDRESYPFSLMTLFCVVGDDEGKVLIFWVSRHRWRNTVWGLWTGGKWVLMGGEVFKSCVPRFVS